MFVAMNIAEYISELLYRHECVVIPGFGALITRRVPAQYFQSTHTIYPPKKGLSFNAQITQSDGLLENYIASDLSIPFSDARLEVERAVQSLKKQMEEQGSATLYKIGRFTHNADQGISFTPMYVMNYLPEAFGLSTQELVAIQHEVATQTEKAEEQQEDQVPVIPMPVQETQQEEASKKSTPWLRYAATGAVLLGLSYVGFRSYENQKQQEAIAIEQKADKHLRTKIQEANIFISDPLPSIELTAAPQIKNFHIIAGAFREPANAAKRVRQLKNKGYNAKVIGVNSYGLHNVAFDSYATREEASNALAELKNLGYDTAWMFVGELPEG